MKNNIYIAIQTINPFKNQVIKSFEEMTPQAVGVLISIADETFQSWRHTTYPHRAELLHKVAKLMRDQKDRLAKLITLEMGKLIAQSYGEIELSAKIIDYYADNGGTFLQDLRLQPKYGEA